ncbi:MAG: HET-C-related protein, partial [Candidatus Omnitrophota bacterium]
MFKNRISIILLFFIIFFLAKDLYAFKTFTVWGGRIHKNITLAAIGDQFTQEAFKYIDKGNTDQDTYPTYFFDSVHHFDNNEIEESIKYVLKEFNDALTLAAQADKNIQARNDALECLGRMFHVIQDFYSHSTYVELSLKNYVPQHDIKPILPFSLDGWKRPEGLRSGYFTAREIGGRSIAISKLRKENKYRGVVFLPDKEYQRQRGETFRGALNYATGEGYDVLHDDISKDNAKSEEGRLVDPKSGLTLFSIASTLALEDTERWWNHFLEEINTKYKERASDIIAALTGKKKPEEKPKPVEKPEDKLRPSEKPIPTKQVKQIEPLEIELGADSTEIAPGQKVKITAKVAGGVKPYKYAWSMDGKVYPSAVNPTATAKINLPGEHIIKVVVTDSEDPQETAEASITIIVKPMSVELSAEHIEISMGQKVKITAKVAGGIKPYKYAWVMDGKAYPKAINPTATVKLNTPGEHEVRVEVTDSSKPQVAEEAGIILIVVKSPEVKIEVDRLKIKPGEKIKATANVLGGIKPYKFSWTVDGQRIAGDKDATIVVPFNDLGQHDISVVLTDSANPEETAEGFIRITVAEPEVVKPVIFSGKGPYIRENCSDQGSGQMFLTIDTQNKKISGEISGTHVSCLSAVLGGECTTYQDIA